MYKKFIPILDSERSDECIIYWFYKCVFFFCFCVCVHLSYKIASNKNVGCPKKLKNLIQDLYKSFLL